MFCINCFHPVTSVSNSRKHKNRPQIWRRRTCAACGTIFTTYERPALSENKSVLRDDQAEVFNIGKLTLSIAQAFTHAPKEAQYNAVFLAQTVEDTLSSQRETITPEDIAATTHQTLRRYDEMAAMQYAIHHSLITGVRRRGRPSLA